MLSGPKGEIRIERNADGVPLITAQDDEDAAFGLGFVHAQDRLFQMELQRRYGAGRLAEISARRRSRPTGRCGCSVSTAPPKPKFAYLSPEMNRALDAYAAGSQCLPGVAPRCVAARVSAVCGFTPEAWRPADRLVWGKLMALSSGATTAANCCAPAWPGPFRPSRSRHSLPGIPEGRPDNPGGDDPDLPPAGSGPLYMTACRRRRAALCVQQLGRRRSAQRQRQAAARQRPASRASAPRFLVSRPAEDTAARDRRRHGGRAHRSS